MYNVEKYIGECLDSVLAQTFQDFEVIIVNDCSTDNSRQIAESYIEKFGGRLKIFDNEKNSGPGATRNRGLRHASGEYIYYMDSDDLILAYGLEKMYSLAKKYDDADFVNFTRYYQMSLDGKEVIPRQFTPRTVPKLLVEENNMPQRIERLKNGWMSWFSYLRLVKRNFLLKNDLFFPENINVSEDRLWTFGLFLSAKKIVQTPTKGYYLYRSNTKSLSKSARNSLKWINTRILPIINGIKYVDNVMSRLDFFKQNPQSRFEILESVVAMFFGRAFKHSLKNQQRDIYESIKQEIGKNFGEHDVLIAQLITFVNTQQKKIATLEEQLKAK